AFRIHARGAGVAIVAASRGVHADLSVAHDTASGERRRAKVTCMSNSYLTWPRNQAFVDSEAYRTDDRLVQEAARKGYRALIDEYVYIDTAEVVRLFSLVPGVKETFRGVGADLGGGVGCISASIASLPEVDQIYCVEIVESAAKVAHPVVVGTILGEQRHKVTSVVGDFDR